MDKVIIVDHLFDNISFTVQSGEFVGLLGPKGSGKTSIIKVISGLKSSDSGFISVLGFDPNDRNFDFLKHVSVVFANKNDLLKNLKVIHSVELNKVIYKINDRDYQKNLDELTNLLSASKLLEKKVSDLSPEQKIKMELVASLIHKPKILLLDEPFTGFDLKVQNRLSDFIYEYTKRNKTTVLLSSDKVSNLFGLVRRVIVIEDKKLLFDGALEKINEIHPKL